MVGLRNLTPSNNFLDSRYRSVGINAGYGKELLKGRVGIDLTAFGDFLGYKEDLPDLRQLDATTFYYGLALTPRYCFNPSDEYVRIFISAAVKGGQNVGLGIVTQTYINSDDKQIENRSVKTGFSAAVAPAIIVTIPGNKVSSDISFGYDSSNFGRGMNKLRSTYYAPINYSSGGIFLGFTFRLGH